MEDVIVSFCIASFQRYEILRELITEILSSESNQFEVVVCDDCSRDGSIEKIKEIQDPRLRVYENKENVGSLQNIYEALEHGRGRYLFYVNDRDNIDPFKIQKLIDLIIKLEKENVAFINCIYYELAQEKYRIFKTGEEALLQFACKIDHPTGYVFRKDVWKKIRPRKKLFEKECYGDFSITMICAIMSLKYNGALIYGDICDVFRKRIDFAKEKSGYYKKRKDKRVWYSPEVQWRELMTAYLYLEKIHVKEGLIDQVLYLRYAEYLRRVVTEYQEIISKPWNTVHYNLYISQNTIKKYVKPIENGLYMWRRMNYFCKSKGKKELSLKINYSTKIEFCKYFEESYKNFLLNRV